MRSNTENPSTVEVAEGSPSEELPELALHEWLAVILLTSLVFFLTLLSFSEGFPSVDDASVHHLKSPLAEIRIEGAVAAPGTYHFPVGTTLAEALAEAAPLSSADLRRFKGQSKVFRGQLLYIKARELLEVEVQGAVLAPGKIFVPRGTRLREIGKYVTLSPQADLQAIENKRYLKAKEVVNIPFKASWSDEQLSARPQREIL